MCPIETPEGPNIGLIGSLSGFARINQFGFIETPYRRVEAGKVTGKIDYLSADEEDRHVIAQANTLYDLTTGAMTSDSIAWCAARAARSTRSPRRRRLRGRLAQAARLGRRGAVPFLGATTRDRALMGANMPRSAQAALLAPRRRFGTGVEFRAAVDAATCSWPRERRGRRRLGRPMTHQGRQGASCTPTT
jgi:DNA-directed RNA polymerase subunit beta